MLPTLCGLLPLLVPLASDPPEILSPQVISPQPRSRQGVIPEVTSPPAAPQARPEDTPAPYEPGLFAKLVLSGRLGRGGVTLTRLPDAGKKTEGDEVSVRVSDIYRAEALTVVTVELKLSAAATTPWVPGEAWLLDAQGRVVGRLPVWMDGARLGPGELRTVAVEVELAPGAAPRALRLELREKDGGRTVRAGELKL